MLYLDTLARLEGGNLPAAARPIRHMQLELQRVGLVWGVLGEADTEGMEGMTRTESRVFFGLF